MVAFPDPGHKCRYPAIVMFFQGWLPYLLCKQIANVCVVVFGFASLFRVSGLKQNTQFHPLLFFLGGGAVHVYFSSRETCSNQEGCYGDILQTPELDPLKEEAVEWLRTICFPVRQQATTRRGGGGA